MTVSLSRLINLYLQVVCVAALVLNSVLVATCLRIKRRSKDIQLAIWLSLVDMVIPTSNLAFAVRRAFDNSDIREAPLICTTLGSIYIIVFGTSVFLVALIALYRWSIVSNKRVPVIINIILAILFCTISILVLIAAVQGKVILLKNKSKCGVDIEDSFLSALTTFFQGFSILSFIVVALSSYCLILRSIIKRHYQDVDYLELEGSKSLSIPESSGFIDLRPIIFRVLSTVLLYLCLIVPPCIMLIAQSFTILPQSIIINQVITACLLSTTYCNPCLVLFAHSAIYRQLIHNLQNVRYSVHP